MLNRITRLAVLVVLVITTMVLTATDAFAIGRNCKGPLAARRQARPARGTCEQSADFQSTAYVVVENTTSSVTSAAGQRPQPVEGTDNGDYVTFNVLKSAVGVTEWTIVKVGDVYQLQPVTRSGPVGAQGVLSTGTIYQGSADGPCFGGICGRR